MPDATGSGERAQAEEQTQAREWLRRAGRGDREAFAALYDTYGDAVFRFLLRLGGGRGRRDVGFAEDLVQEVFVKVWRAAPRYDPAGSPKAWILTIALHHAWNAGAHLRRRRGVWQGMPQAPEAGESGAPEATREPDRPVRAELRAALGSALARLSPKLRVVFILVRLEHQSLADTADIVGIPLGTVKSRLAAAERKLRRDLRPFLD